MLWVSFVLFDCRPLGVVPVAVKAGEDHRAVVQRGDKRKQFRGVRRDATGQSHGDKAGWRGGERRQARAVCCSSTRLRRDSASRASSSARIRGQWCGRISRNWWIARQCSASPSGTKSTSLAKLAPSVATLSRSRARLAASAAACPGRSGSSPRRSPQCRTSRVSSNRRRSSGMGGGTAMSSAPPSDNDSSSEARSPIGRIRGSSNRGPRHFAVRCYTQECIRSERAPAGRQQNGYARQHQRIGARHPEQPGRQRRQKRPVRGDPVDLGLHSISNLATARCDATTTVRGVVARPCGVPM